MANRYELSDEDWEGIKEYFRFSRWEDPQSGGINYAERDPLVCSERFRLRDIPGRYPPNQSVI